MRRATRVVFVCQPFASLFSSQRPLSFSLQSDHFHHLSNRPKNSLRTPHHGYSSSSRLHPAYNRHRVSDPQSLFLSCGRLLIIWLNSVVPAPSNQHLTMQPMERLAVADQLAEQVGTLVVAQAEMKAVAVAVAVAAAATVPFPSSRPFRCQRQHRRTTRPTKPFRRPTRQQRPTTPPRPRLAM